MTDPATWREAARQLREEARLYGARDKDSDVDQATDSAVAGVLESMAHRFENEARAAEKATEET